MLKKSLIALAIASVAGSVSAADIQANTTYSVLSQQGANINQDLVAYDSTFVAGPFAANNSVVVTLDGEYSVGDIITFTFAGGDLDTATVTNATAAVVGLPVVTGSTETSSMVLGLLNKSKSEIKYRVTELSYAADLDEADKTTIGATLVLGGYTNSGTVVTPLSFDTASVLASKQLTVTYAAETSTGIELDKGSKNSTIIFDVKNQYEAEVEQAFDAVIDVNTHRLSFISGTTNYVEDTVALDADEVIYSSSDAVPVAFPYTHSATAKEVTYQINGDFSFLGEADDDGVITTSKVDFNGADTGVVYTDKLVATYAGLTTNDIPAVTIDVNVEGSTIGQAESALKTQEFTADVTLDYTMYTAGQGQVQLLNAANAGQWTLNGAIVHVPFMPFRTGYSPIVNVSNTSSQDGDIEVLVYAENDASWVEPISYMLAATAKAESQTNITPALQAAGIEGDVAFDIIVNAPRDDIEVNALFYRNGDRAVINTVKQ